MESSIRSYQARIATLEEEIERLSRLSKRYALLRLFIVVAGIILFFSLSGLSMVLAGILLLLLLIAFIFVLMRHDTTEELKRRAGIKKTIAENEIACLRHFENCYYDGRQFERPGHYYTLDLDVFGSFSLFGLINRCRTFQGNTRLAGWLSNLSTLNSINMRKEAVQELERQTEWRLSYLTALFEHEEGFGVNYAEKIKKELDANLTFVQKPWLHIYQNLLPLIWIAIIILSFWNWEISVRLGIMYLLINLGVSMNFVKPISEVQNKLSNSSQMLEQFMSALKLVMDHNWETELNSAKVKAFAASENVRHPVEILKSLKRIIDQLDYRLNMIAAFILNGVVLWDIRMMNKLNKWKVKNLDKIPEIFDLLGHFEAISSLGTWSYNHPEYNYAEIIADDVFIHAEKIGHPLIQNGQCVENDYMSSRPATVSIITGSNMAGKSTFLRTLGTNILLAYLGTKVYAKEFELSVFQLMTYMRIKDALEENVSTFKAELNRVELMLKLLNEKSHSLILIDEMLRGTNSNDKLKGSIGITKKLISVRASALIATHDIKLAELVGEYPDQIQNYYFDIDFENGELRFDYKLKKGICENFNASFLLNQIGIGD